MQVPVIAATPELQQTARDIATRWQLDWLEQKPDTTLPKFVLELDTEGLALRWTEYPKMLPLRIDFVEGKTAFRAAHASRKHEAIARACGFARNPEPHILDATAGLGRDALVLAQLGARVALNERNPVVAALLTDALKRLEAVAPELARRLYFAGTDSLQPRQWLADPVDVVYLDPMYPKGDRKQRAAVKKDMQMFQQLVGSDSDADSLLDPALAVARKRVVVKRPQHADFLAGRKPESQITGKKHRFDIYFTDYSGVS
ncbi:class I SAM-dependent methyltransferase [Pseudidiomarina sp.]|uniref:class I SAM-dependent methyltransferase n=1 Tax=Pseudidiomarina sp. TaxID=2081707 RepID=UPI00299F2EEB|nr:class I SAM-dependent methyltransferase [Pseudidiomarina sp.]MDX1706051.1 class I SAM-dependent methyltransferase [Pseudidiomarina sp.]